MITSNSIVHSMEITGNLRRSSPLRNFYVPYFTARDIQSLNWSNPSHQSSFKKLQLKVWVKEKILQNQWESLIYVFILYLHGEKQLI
jgi:hypothetical protein